MRLAGDASPACLAGHPVPPGVVEVGMEHMPKPDRHESIMTAALGRPARRPSASILTGRLPMHPAHCASTAGGLDSRPSYRRLTQPERCKARPTSRTPSAQAGDPLGTGVNYPKLDEPGGHRRTKTHPGRWVIPSAGPAKNETTFYYQRPPLPHRKKKNSSGKNVARVQTGSGNTVNKQSP